MRYYIYAFEQVITLIELFNMVYNLEYTNFVINIAKSFHKLWNGKHLKYITLVTEDDIQVRA